MSVLRSLVTALVASSLLFASTARATSLPNLIGGYAGAGNGVESGCSDPTENGPFSIFFTQFVIKQQTANNFVGVFSAFTDGDPQSEAFALTGSVAQNGSVTGTFRNATFLANFTGSFNAGRLAIAFNGGDINPIDCTTTGNVILTTGAVVPSGSSGSSITSGQTTATNTRSLSGKLFARTQVRRTRVRSGGTPRPSGGSPAGGGKPPKSGAAPDTTSLDGDDNRRLNLSFERGLSAGDAADLPWAVWGSLGYTRSENTFSLTRFESDRYSVLGGIDVTPNDSLVVGLALGYENSDVDTAFNLGSQKITGFTLAPYAGWLLTDRLSMDFSMGVSDIDIEQSRRLLAGGTAITAKAGSRRRFWAANANYEVPLDDWFIAVRGGLLWSNETISDFTESDGTQNARQSNSSNQWRLGAEASYSYGNWEPYGNLTYEKDYHTTSVTIAGSTLQPANDTDDFLLGVGLRYYGKDGISGSLEYSSILARKEYNEDSLNLVLRAAY